MQSMTNARFASTMLAIITATALSGFASSASASECGSFTADSGANKIILGEAMEEVYPGAWVGTNDLAICWRDSSAVWHYVVKPVCDTSSSTADYVRIYAGAGNDQLAKNVYGEQECGTGQHIGVFDAGFAFYLWAEMGTGSDTVHGTNQSDNLFSNSAASSTADSANDTLCGWGGTDTMTGDLDDSSTYQEYFVGGAGSDTCHGGESGGGGTTYDHAQCETYDHAVYDSISTVCGKSYPVYLVD